MHYCLLCSIREVIVTEKETNTTIQPCSALCENIVCLLQISSEWKPTNIDQYLVLIEMESNHSKQRPCPCIGYICDAQVVQLTNEIGKQTRNICNEKQHDYINAWSFSKFYLLRHTKRFVKWFVLICTRCHAWSDASIKPKNRILISTCKWKCTHWTSTSIATMHFFDADSNPPVFAKLYWMLSFGYQMLFIH